MFRVTSVSILLISCLLILSCHFQKENSQVLKKDYLSILWVEKKLEDNKKLPQLEIEFRKKEAKALFEKAVVLKKKKLFSESILSFESAIDKEINADGYYEYANVLSNAKRWDDAIKAYKISLQLEYKRPELVLYNIACAYSLLNDEDNTYKYLEKAIQKGYKAFEYMEKDPDLKNIREKDRLKWWQKTTGFTLPDREINAENVTGFIGERMPRPASYYFLCKNGVVVRTDFEPWSCGNGYDKGKWQIVENQIEFSWEESCKPLGKKLSPYFQASEGCKFSEYQFQSCQKISHSNPQYGSKTFSKFEDYQIKTLFSDSKFPWGLWREKTNSEPPQCNPDFVPKNLDELRWRNYFRD